MYFKQECDNRNVGNIKQLNVEYILSYIYK